METKANVHSSFYSGCDDVPASDVTCSGRTDDDVTDDVTLALLVLLVVGLLLRVAWTRFCVRT